MRFIIVRFCYNLFELLPSSVIDQGISLFRIGCHASALSYLGKPQGCVQEPGVLFNFRLLTVWQTSNRLNPGLSSLAQNLHYALRP